jgi:mono/diheme cytochrome c family protein
MAKISLAGFKDPVRRPRFIVWTFVVVLALAAFVVVMLGATSTRWFCSEVCHKVQDDTIAAYNASTHAEISCMACHEPVGADTIVFMIAKVKSGLEVIPTVGNTFSLPLNPGSALALKGGKEMGSQQCTQCHSQNREVTASEGLIVNHKVHADANIHCTVCHNRIAHNDTAAKPTLVAPNGSENKPHQNFMKMEFCYRCHDLEGKTKMTGEGAKAASGTCATCHPTGFKLIPETHETADWASKGHGEANKEILKEMVLLEEEAKVLEEEGIEPYLALPVDPCFTCHVEKDFCEPCHDSLKVGTTEG